MSNNDKKYEDLLGAIPTRRWRLGLLLVVMMIVVIAALVWWLDYRNAVEVRVQIYGSHRSLDIRTDRAGVIEQLWVKNGAVVEKGAPIILFKNEANLSDVKQLLSWLRQGTSDQVPEGKYGSLSGGVGALKALGVQLQIIQNSSSANQAIWIERSRDSLSKILPSIDRQVELMKEEETIAKANFEEYQLLFKTGAASRLETNDAKTRWLRLQRSLVSKQQERNEIAARLSLQKGQAVQVTTVQKEKIALLMASIEAQKQTLLHQIEAWQANYFLKTPVSGQLNLLPVVQEGTFLQRADLIAKVVAVQDSSYQVEGLLPPNRSGEVKVGDEVLLRVDAYPYRKFGQLKARVKSIGNVYIGNGNRSGIPVTMQLEDGLATTQGKVLTYKDGMPALARIMVK